MQDGKQYYETDVHAKMDVDVARSMLQEAGYSVIGKSQKDLFVDALNMLRPYGVTFTEEGQA